ncbi:hypothetical protein F383_26935 [Gossypium arboreum]|uniref:Uncharacterized protein n=1 Tax=Gossypium arboreum TaxID=29729 RepID=A0A0B0MSB6_GOSAR|nr:hypothetical protein F383_23308 [Gossypium arboreum]KHG03639.1 hypothetical protein F383_26935 [Gossypium arboreum]
MIPKHNYYYQTSLYMPYLQKFTSSKYQLEIG